ncbi:MAG: TetR/AcrR family transcriptional regulator [Ancrocorticia sp.]
MPTGVALQDARAQLLAAAERVLIREGVAGLTSRAITEEAGVAKGILHRYFTDFNSFLIELVREHISQVEAGGRDLMQLAGRYTPASNLVTGLTHIFDPVRLPLITLVMARNQLRSSLMGAHQKGMPLLVDATHTLADYLEAERGLGRIASDTDVQTLALTLTGSGHLLFASELGRIPDEAAIRDVVESILSSATPAPATPEPETRSWRLFRR